MNIDRPLPRGSRIERGTRKSRLAWRLLGLALALPGVAFAQSTERASVDSAEVEGNDGSFMTPEVEMATSADGRFVVFWSLATNLVPGDTNATRDVFLRDRLNGTTERISVNSAGVQGDEESGDPSISADGRFVSFTSHATNLVTGDTNGSYDVFVRDRLNNTTVRVSVASGGTEGNAHSLNSAISADGRYVTFQSDATTFDAGDTNGVTDIYVHDLQTGTTERVSLDSGEVLSDGVSRVPAISSDGRYVAFESDATNLVAADTNTVADIFLRDRLLGTTVRVSVTSGEAQATGASSYPAISPDGGYVVFESLATDLVGSDTNGTSDIFLRDLGAGTTERVSVDSSEAQGNGYSARASVATNGSHVAFTSSSSNLVPSDTNGGEDIFVRNRLDGTTERASVQSDGSEAGSSSFDASISSNGQYVVFGSLAPNLVTGDTNNNWDVFLRDRGGDVEADGDSDGVPDSDDNCPTVANPGQEDADVDGTGDACDGCPNDPTKSDQGQCGCGIPDTDTDGDGRPDCLDGCPTDPAKWLPGICGCGTPDADSDGDTVADCIDGCPNDPAKVLPGICGCGVAEGDLDGDGVLNCFDGCPNDPAKIAPGTCGCGVADTDGDGDGTLDCNDGCPSDPAKTAPGNCGCGVLDIDSDGDGTADCADGCPNDPAKTAPGDCGCGVADTDTDGDGTLDCNDGCPNDPAKTEPGQAGCGVPEGGGEADCHPRRNPGSLLIFPEFDNRAGDLSQFTVTNTNTDFSYDPRTNLPRGTVRVHFIYVGRYDANGNPTNCLEVDREVTLTPGDTFTFRTKTHNPQQQQGFMYAFAQHPTSGQPISFNYLIGSAIFINGINAIDYSTNPVSLVSPLACGISTDIDHDGNRDLDGREYEKLPDEILIPRFLATGGILRSELILLGLSGGASFDTVVDFLVYNDNEEVFSAQRLFRCWERAPLDVISGIFTQSFLVTTHHAVGEPLGAPARESGWMQIDGSVAFSTVEQIDDPAIYAVLVERVARGAGAADLPFEVGCQDNGSLWPYGPFGDNALGDNR